MVADSPLTRRALQAFGFLLPNKSHFGVAVSGGSDSMALLMLAADYCAARGASVSAVSVDHGLRPEAKEEARFVGRICKQLGIAHAILRWRRADDDPVSQQDARWARHGLLARWAKRTGITQIALGHTRDDRLETFLMRARQGSGWHGLAGLMPESPSPVWPEGRGVRLARPLLAFGREELRTELHLRNMSWVEDPSNEIERFERVRMRRLLGRMDPASLRKTVGVMDRLSAMRTAVAAEASGLLSDLGVQEPGRADFCLLRRKGVSAEAWMRLVEALVMAGGGARLPPRRDALERLLARIDARDPALERGVTLGGAKIRIRKGVFLAFSKAPPRRGMPAGEPPDWGRAGALLAPPDLRSLHV